MRLWTANAPGLYGKLSICPCQLDSSRQLCGMHWQDEIPIHMRKEYSLWIQDWLSRVLYTAHIKLTDVSDGRWEPAGTCLRQIAEFVEDMTCVYYYLKLHEFDQHHNKGCMETRTHFKTPYNFDERIDVREVDHQIIIDAMDGQCKVHTIKCPKQSWWACQCNSKGYLPKRQDLM